MSGVLNYNNFFRFKKSKDLGLFEGIRYECNDPSRREHGGKIEIDWSQDSELDVVKLAPPSPTRSSRISRVETFAGYALENPVFPGEPNRHSTKRCFSEFIKNWGAINQEDLKNLINLTYPEELKSANVKLLFVMGSSAPLSANIATALKEMYYRDAKIIDIMKAYYGADVEDIVDREKYSQVDPTTRSMIDTFVGGFKSKWEDDGTRIPPKNKWEGYIKKSSGLQSGARSVLKPGHMIDDYIISSIRSEMSDWSKKYSMGDYRISKANMPHFLAVDDIIIAGSTMKNAISMILRALSNPENQIEASKIAEINTHGYVLFSYGNRFG